MTKQKFDKLSAASFLPSDLSIPSLKHAAKNCRGCHLYKNAKQTVFGEGSATAQLIVVGEIPGEKEDDLGQPFTGPAGKLLHSSIESVGLDSEEIYYTNVVKHFKFVFSNKRKIHRSPLISEIKACRPWLDAEITTIQPKVILCLGSTAAKTLINKSFQVKTQHGKWFDFSERSKLIVTFHPSAILRSPDHDSREQLKKFFINDIRKVARYLAK